MFDAWNVIFPPEYLVLFHHILFFIHGLKAVNSASFLTVTFYARVFLDIMTEKISGFNCHKWDSEQIDVFSSRF